MTLTDHLIVEYNKLGFVPGPDEDEYAYLKRVDYCLNLKTNLSADKSLDVPNDLNVISTELSHELSSITVPLFDINPTWIPVAFSNQKLAPWHGGCAWIFQLTEETPMGAFLQLRRAFAKEKRYLGLYDRSELLAHESSHVGRMLFEEPKFEEMLAYRTSPSLFRRWFGPIFQSAWESMLFLFSLLFFIAIELYAMSYNTSALWAVSFPLILLVLGVGRLWRRHCQFNRCLESLKVLFGEEKGNAIIYRLTDREIIAFGQMSLDEILQYTASQKKQSLRWHVICINYCQSK